MLLVTSVCVSIKPYGPCPTLTVRLPPRELPPIDLALPHGGAFLVRPQPRNKFCRWVEPFAPLSDTNVASRVSRRNFSTYQIWGWRGRLADARLRLLASGNPGGVSVNVWREVP